MDVKTRTVPIPTYVSLANAVEDELLAARREAEQARQQPASSPRADAAGSSGPQPDAERSAPGDRRDKVTPADFKNLLPGRGSIHGIFYGKHDPAKYFRVEYPCA